MKLKYDFSALKILYKANKRLFCCTAIFIIGLSFLTTVQFIAVQGVVDSLFEIEKSKNQLILYGCLLVATGMFETCSGSIEKFLLLRVDHVIMYKVMPEIISKELHLSYDVLMSDSVRDLLKRLSNAPYLKLKNNIMAWFQLIRCVLAIICLGIYFVSMSYLLSSAFLVVAVLLCLSNFYAAHEINKVLNDQCQEEREVDYYCKLLGEKESLFELSIFGAVKTLYLRYSSLANKLYQVRLKKTFKGQKWLAVSYILMGLWIGLAVIWSSYHMISGHITNGTMVSLIGTSVQIANLADSFALAYNRVIFSTSEVKCYEKFMKLPEKEKGENIKYDIYGKDLTVRIQNVTYIYPNTGRKILDNITMSFELSDHLAIVGRNGAGKSTLIKLICGIIQPNEGNIYIGDTNLKDIAIEDRTKIICAVFQDYYKYPLTMKDNITLSNLNAAEEKDKIYEVLDLIGAHELKKYINMELGKFDSESIELSEGQWQSLALARVIFSPAKLLVMDEPTSALDPLAESTMYENFYRLLKARGLIMVSHRMASARMADMIYVLDSGKIVEQGNHEELMNMEGIYFTMYNSQAYWYKEGFSNEEI